MDTSKIYHPGSRQMQDRFDSRRLADRQEKVIVHSEFDEEDRAFIERCSMFFLATADADGLPDCSYRGGIPGFVRVIDDRTLVFPNYDGNGMFKSLGNLLMNPKVGLLFIDFEQPERMRVQGAASVHDDDPLLSKFPGAKLIVRVKAESIFPNCSRYIHKMKMVEHSIFAPREDHTPPEPGWKQNPAFRDALPGKDKAKG